MTNSENIVSSNKTITDEVNIHADGTFDSTLDQEPIQDIPLEEIVLNLGFWLDMAIHQGKRIAVSKFNGMSKSEPDKE